MTLVDYKYGEKVEIRVGVYKGYTGMVVASACGKFLLKVHLPAGLQSLWYAPEEIVLIK